VQSCDDCLCEYQSAAKSRCEDSEGGSYPRKEGDRIRSHWSVPVCRQKRTAAFDDRPAPNRADPGPAPPMRVILPAYAEPAPGMISVPEQSQTDAQAAKPEPAQEATKAVAQVEKADLRKAERQSRVAARRQAERKARKIAAAKVKQRLEAQRREEPAIMAFGGDGPPLFGN
jgi:hypothetical protein